MRSFFSSLLISVALIILIPSCNTPIAKDQSESYADFALRYDTQQFSIKEKNDLYLLEVKQCFKGSSKAEKYLLYPRGKEIVKQPSITHYIPYPNYNMAISSTTHLGFIESLGMQQQISGATNLSLYYSESFQEKIKTDM